MKVTSSKSETYHNIGWTGQKSYYKQLDQSLSKTMQQRLIKYAFNRLDQDIVKMIISAKWDCHIDRLCNHDNEKLNDCTYQVNFKNERGVRISIDGILLKDYKPFLDHGLSLDENQ